MKKEFISVQKLERLKGVQTELTKGSPFFFEDIKNKEPAKKPNLGDWIMAHRIEAIGFGVLIVGAIVVASLV